MSVRSILYYYFKFEPRWEVKHHCQTNSIFSLLFVGLLIMLIENPPLVIPNQIISISSF